MSTISNTRGAPLCSDIATGTAPSITITATDRTDLQTIVDGIDGRLADTLEDHNIIVHGGGDVSFNGTTGALTISSDLYVEFTVVRGTGSIGYIRNTIAATSFTLANGDYLYLPLNRSSSVTIVPVVVASATGIPALNSATTQNMVLALRRDVSGGVKRVYLKTGQTIDDGQSVKIGGSKIVRDDSFVIGDAADTTKQIKFNAAGTAGTATTLVSSQSSDVSLTFPNITDTLVTKTSTDILTNKDIDGGTADNTHRLTVPKADKTTLDALTRKEATLVYASDLDKLFVDNGTDLQAIGSGLGELNYITNPSAESVITGWTSSAPSDLVVSRIGATSETPREFLTGSAIKIVGSGNDETNDYVYSNDLILDDVDLGRVLKIQWDQKVIGSYTAGQLVVEIAKNTGATLVATPVTSSIPASDGSFATTFITSDTSTLQLRIRATANMTSGAGIAISNVIVGPGTLVQGVPVSDWQSWTPTGSWTTDGTNGVTYTGRKRRVGDSADYDIRVYVNGTSSISGALTITLPDTIDTAKLCATSTQQFLSTEVDIYDASGAQYLGVINYNSSTVVSVGYLDDSAAAIERVANVSPTTPMNFAAGDFLHIKISNLPISSWSTGLYLGSGADTAVTPLNWTTLACTASWTTNTNIATKGRRVGDSLEVLGVIDLSGDPNAGTLTVTLPSGYVIDTSKLVATYTYQNLGTVVARDNSTSASVTGPVKYNNTTSVVFLVGGISGGGTDGALSSISDTGVWPWAFDNNDTVSFHFIVPIVGWTAQDYIGKMLSGFASAKVGIPGLVNNDSSNTSGTPIRGITDGTAATTGYVGEVLSFTLRSVTVTTHGNYYANATPLVTLSAGSWLLFFDVLAACSGTADRHIGLISTNSTADATCITSANLVTPAAATVSGSAQAHSSYGYTVASSTPLYAKATSEDTDGVVVSITGYAVRIR